MNINLSINQSANSPITLEPSVIISNVLPLALLTIGIFIYAFLIFKFYKYLARRDIVKLKLDVNKSFSVKIIMYLLNQIVIVPVLIFFWFLIMACVLISLSNTSAAYVLFVSMGIIAAIRITSYYNQSLSEDLAKLLPLTLFAVFIMDLNLASIGGKILTIKDLFGYQDKLVFYLIFAVVVELIMRVQQIIRDVIKISRHNKQIITSSSKQEKKSYNIILDGSFEELSSMRNAQLKEEKTKTKVKREKQYNDDASL